MQIRGEAEPDPDDVAILERGISESMVAASGHHDIQELAAFARDDGDAVWGGVYGWTWGGCCELQHLWVHPSLRGTGVGGRLLGWAEAKARARHCSQVVLFTHASQVPGLYARRGYRLVGRVDDYPAGDLALWFCKSLNPGDGAG